MAPYHLLPPDTHVYIPAGRLFFGRAGLLPAELHQLTLAHALFFQILLTAEFAENAEETKSPSQLHQREFLHIKNLRALGVLGGKTTELALNWLCFSAASAR